MSKTLYFSLMVHSISRQHSADTGPDFNTKTGKSERYRTYLPKDKTAYLLVLKLFQPRRTVNCRIMTSSLRRLEECYKLNTIP